MRSLLLSLFILQVSIGLCQVRPATEWKTLSKKGKDGAIVTNKEYLSFVEYVADSSFRAALGAQGDKRYLTKKDGKSKIIWDSKIKHTEPKTYATLDEFRVTQVESIKKHPEWNFGKLKYLNPRTGKLSWVYPDTLVWLRKGEPSTLAASLSSNYFRHKVYQDAPVVGVDEDHAKMFGEWLTNQFNRMAVSKQKVNVRCKIVPRVIPTLYYNKRPEWNISVDDYVKFAKWVRDSLTRLRLGEELNEIYLIESDEYGDLDEPGINWEPIIPWGRFNDKEKEALEPFITGDVDPELEFIKNGFVYRYMYFDLIEGSRDTLRGRFDRSGLKKKVSINIYPGHNSKSSTPNFNWKQKGSITKQITYDQAVAYFRWRSITTSNSKDPIQPDWIPTHQEWIEFTETNGEQPKLPQIPRLSGLSCTATK